MFKFDTPKQDENNSYILDQMEDLGYSTHNSIINLGSIGLFSFIYLCKVVFYMLLLIPMVVITGSDKMLDWAQKIKNGLFFTEFISITLEGYFEFLISAYLNLYFPLTTTDGESAANYVGWYSFVIPCIVFPLMWVFICFLPLKTLNSEYF